VLGPAPSLKQGEVSHGICNDCARKLAGQMGINPDELIGKMNQKAKESQEITVDA
jgi:hypothetical protein